MATVEMGYGKGTIQVEVPDNKILHIIEGKQTEPVQDVRAAVREALANPIGTLPLKQTVQSGDKVVIVASDITRAWIRHDLFLPVLLDELNSAGIPDSDISLVVALGAHRYHTEAENSAVYGSEVVNRIRILQSCAMTTEDFVYLGTTSRGVRCELNKHVVNADKVILTGGIVYHLMAGFGGGRKAIMPGVAGYATIQGNHTFCLDEEVGKGTSSACASGKLEGNNMHEDQLEMAKMLNPAFLLNVVLTAEGEFARFVAGHWHEAWLSGCETVSEIFGVPIQEKADIVIATAGGYPKDINFYQGTKAQDNAAMACKEDGVVILMLGCSDISEPPDFMGWFAYESLYDREIELRKAFTVPGFVALQLGEQIHRRPHIVITLPENKEIIEKTGMYAAATIEEAMQLAEEKLGRSDYRVTLMPHAANTVPLLIK
ncbi:MAG TPA: nickel-dependent lactate racemase [Sporomusaceae bacterium]|nr:nickel-dependent lactate racemase [Sporomusaceae bacterium]